jgi:hypothetical protein
MSYPNVELLAGAIRQMSEALEHHSLRSCGVACLLFKVLARDNALGENLCAACQDAGNTLERFITLRAE